VKAFSKIAKPLTQFTKKGENFVWTEECEAAFLELKHRLTTTPVLTIPNQSGDFIIYSNASRQGLGRVLMQHDKVVAMLQDSSSQMSRTI